MKNIAIENIESNSTLLLESYDENYIFIHNITLKNLLINKDKHIFLMN